MKLIHSRNVLIGTVIILIIVVFLLILNTVNAEKLNWGMKIAETSIGGMYPNEAEQLLKSRYQTFLEKDFFLNYQDYFWQANANKLGVKIDISASINSAYNKNNIWWQARSLLGYNIKTIWTADEQKLEDFLKTNLGSIHQPARNASLVYDEEKQDFIITSSSEGIVINKEKLKKELAKNINNYQANDIDIVLIKDYPEVLESETNQAKQQIDNILSVLPINLFIIEDEGKIEIDSMDKDTLLDLMDFGPVIDPENPDNKILGIKFIEEKIKAYLITLSPLVNREPVDAKLATKNDKVVAFALSQDGLKLEMQENISILVQNILNKGKSIELKTIKTKPKITTDSINNMGITALLAKGGSNFSGSPNNRIHNIKIGAARFNGVLIKPKEEFSFNEILGEVGPDQGYLPELVIKKDKTVPEYGGGLCQVSTTTFRAAINAGLEITERYPHAFPVKYYDPQGFDATIYPPFPDLKFINNTPGYILVQTKVEAYNLIFEFYGTDDNRKVKIDGPFQYDIKEDGSMKAKLSQKVYDKNNQLIIDKTFYSNYKSPDLYPVQRNPLE